MWTGLLYLISVVFCSFLFYKLGQEDGFEHGKKIGFGEGYAKSIHDRIKKL